MEAEELEPGSVDSRDAEEAPPTDTKPQQDEDELRYVNTRRLNGVVSAPGTPLPSTHRRRQTLPLNVLGLWSLSSRNTSTVSLADPEHQGNGEYTNGDSTAARLSSALRQLNSGPRAGRHRYAKSAIVGNSTFSQPVIVRTYSGNSRPESRQRVPAIREEEEMDWADLPPIDAFSFDGVLKAIEPEVSNTLDAIASLCSNYRSNLAHECDHIVGAQGELDKKMEDTDVLTTRVLEETVERSERLSSDTKPLDSGKLVSDIASTATAAYGTLQDIISTLTAIDELLPPEERIGDKDHYPKTHSLLATKIAEHKAAMESSRDIYDAAAATALPDSPVSEQSLWKRRHTPRSKSASLVLVGGSLDRSYGKRTDMRVVTSPSAMFLRVIEPAPSTASVEQSSSWYSTAGTSGILTPDVVSRPQTRGLMSTESIPPTTTAVTSPPQMNFAGLNGDVPTANPFAPPIRRSSYQTQSNSSRGTTGHVRRSSIFGRWQDWLTRDAGTSQQANLLNTRVTSSNSLGAEDRLRVLLRGAGPDRTVAKGKGVDRRF